MNSIKIENISYIKKCDDIKNIKIIYGKDVR